MICYNLFSDGADIISAPKNKTVLEFYNVSFFCNASSNPPSQIIWTQEGNSTVLHKGETFVVENVSRKLNGQRYKCRTGNNVTKDVEAYAHLSVYCKYDIMVTLQNHKDLRIQKLVMYCKGRANGR